MKRRRDACQEASGILCRRLRAAKWRLYMKYFLILLVLALIASSCGFYKYVWFISIGYGAAVALIGAGLLVLFSGNLTAGSACCSSRTAAGFPDILHTAISKPRTIAG